MNNMLTIKEVAKFLRVSRQKVSQLISDGKLKAVMVDNRYRISHKDLETFIKENTIGM
jgi:excisionase family DNA binding protein